MKEKATHTGEDEVVSPSAPLETTAKPETKKKGCLDRCVENPGFPWMVIAVLFTLLVIMFWREHYYGYRMWGMHSGNVFYRNDRMMDDNYGPMRERGMRYSRQKIEDMPVETGNPAAQPPAISNP